METPGVLAGCVVVAYTLFKATEIVWLFKKK